MMKLIVNIWRLFARYRIMEDIHMIIDDTVVDYYERCQKDTKEHNKLKNSIKDAVGEYIWKKTKRRPMVLPVILEVG